ncbi:hypothetical protein IKF23_03255, partial [Candidatus Saccharibacteria bacterium]|nr:hypothetical protein [Candidatus Saccharibacteria bacterium]
NLDVSVATNNLNGYKLYLNTIEDTTSLTRQNDGTSADSLNATIETLPSSGEGSCANGCTESTFPTNYWGYRISGTTGASGSTDSSISDFTNTKYFPFTPSAIISSSEGTTNEITSTLSFASKIDYNRPSGVYNLNLNFQALPKMSNYYMQDFYNNPELAEQLCTEDPTMVMDKRDGHTYAIARLKDGKCWMVQNLRLGDTLATTTGEMALTQEDSNVGAEGFVLTNKLIDGHMPRESASAVYDGSAFYCADYGCYYNFYTATASSGSSLTTGDGTNAEYSICPKGWALPTGGTGTTNNQARDLIAAYDWNTNNNMVVVPNSAIENINGGSLPGLTLGGVYFSDGPSVYIDRYGFYITSTNNTAEKAYHIYISITGGASLSDTNNKYDGRSVRCLLNE